MSGRYADVWAELERAPALDAAGSGYPRRRLRPDAACDLFLAVKGSPARRTLQLVARLADVRRAARELPTASGIEAAIVSSAGATGRVTLELILVEPRYEDIFDALIADVVRVVTAGLDERACVMAILGQIRRWQRFLQERMEGLEPEEQRGLFGELCFLRDVLLEPLGPEAAVGGWKGPLGANQDFQLEVAAIEVKTTTANSPQKLSITNERQLDSTGVRRLLLCHFSLDSREGGGGSLPELVAELRRRLLPDPIAAELFEERLLDVGYLDAHAPRYEQSRYTVRSTSTPPR